MISWLLTYAEPKRVTTVASFMVMVNEVFTREDEERKFRLAYVFAEDAMAYEGILPTGTRRCTPHGQVESLPVAIFSHQASSKQASHSFRSLDHGTNERTNDERTGCIRHAQNVCRSNRIQSVQLRRDDRAHRRPDRPSRSATHSSSSDRCELYVLTT
jgi:hypothetical protein